MREYVNACNECPECRGCGRRNRRYQILICDECRREEDVLYRYEGRHGDAELCDDCLLACFEQITADEDEEAYEE